MYVTEEAVGAAIKEALGRKLTKNREELFVSTELWCNLRLIVCYWPSKSLSVTVERHVLDLAPKEGEVSLMDIKSVWSAMEEVHKLGVAKSIGFSNFTCKKLTELLAHAKIIPSVNQVKY
ncbi:hypothetical protein Sjap_000746 [Stephania japonica]|uniref:NADP-dependent oxidoreductase domain-containing protein n=1 Tax=Stephania japonica TaxID=461633 RepID=A0AAP0PUD3_9MAGN